MCASVHNMYHLLYVRVYTMYIEPEPTHRLYMYMHVHVHAYTCIYMYLSYCVLMRQGIYLCGQV